MGLYLRKAFRFGPLRLNLSKSGLGVSAGLKGLRIGTGPRGAYVHAGRGGLYWRKSLRAGQSEPLSPDAPSPPPSAHSASTAFTEGGISIEAAPIPATMRVHVKRRSGPLIAAIAGGIVLALIVRSAQSGVPLLLVILLTVGLSTGLVLLDARYERRLNEYINTLSTLFGRKPPMPSDQLAHVTRLQREGRFKPEHLLPIHRVIYSLLLLKLMTDSVIEESERTLLAQAARLLTLSASDAQHARIEAFKRLYLELIADHELSEAEDQTLRQIQQALTIPDGAIHEEVQTITELREARTIREGDLKQIPVDIALPAGEICYHRTTGQLLEKRVLRSYTLNRVRHKEEGLVPTGEGKVYLTSKRIVLVGDGVTSYQLGKVLDVDVDMDKKHLTLTVDGRKRPVYLAVPDAIVTGAMIERLSGDK